MLSKEIWFDVSWFGRGETPNYIWGHTEIRLGHAAFVDWNTLISTLAHESIHVGQGYFYLGYRRAWAEVEAYNFEIELAMKNGIDPYSIENLYYWRNPYLEWTKYHFWGPIRDINP